MSDSIHNHESGVGSTGASNGPVRASTEVVVHEFVEQTVVHSSRPPERDPAAVYLARLDPGSRRTMRGALATMAALLAPGVDPPPDPVDFPWKRIRAQHAKAIRAQLEERYRFTTTNKLLSALRGVLREAWELGLMHTEDYHRAAAVRAVKGQRASQATGRSLGRTELRALIQACLKVVHELRSADAEVEAFSPHDLRRSHVGDLLDEGADLSVAQQLAGHASPTTTAGYDRRGERAKQQAAARLDVPNDAE